MTQPTLEERVDALEKQVTELKLLLANGARIKDWRRTIGRFTGDEVMQQIFDEALKFRERDREKARRKYAKRAKAKK